MPSWPSSLPLLGQIGAQLADDDSVVEFAPDTGPTQRRNRSTAITQSLSYTMTLTGAQLATLNAFYRTDLRNGALSFDWLDPTDDTAAVVRFKSPPEKTARVGGADTSKRLWIVKLSLEIQP